MKGGRDHEMRARASGRARVYQSAGSMSITDNSKHDHHYDDNPLTAFFTGRGPGRALMVVGGVVALFGFVGWASIIFGGFNGDISGPEDFLGARLPSGIPVGVVYFIGFGAGGILFAIGQAMAKAAASGSGRAGHLVVTVVIIALTAGALIYVLGGAPVSALTPTFGSATGTSAATEVISDSAKSARRGGLTMTVSRIENVGGKGHVHVRLVNKSGSSLTLPAGFFKLTDGDGRAYEANSFSEDWTQDIGSGATQAGILQLEKRVEPDSGPLRAEFTTVFGPAVRSIAVTGIRTG